MKIVYNSFFLIFLVLSSCTTNGPMNMQILQKDNSKIYHATWSGRSFGNAGFIAIDLAGKRYRGEPGRVDEANLFGLRARYGSPGRQLSGSSLITTFYRAILVNDDGVGMRCDFYIDYSSGSGLCVDETQKVYEVNLTP